MAEQTGRVVMLLSLFTSTGPTKTLPNQQTIKSSKTVPWVQPLHSLVLEQYNTLKYVVHRISKQIEVQMFKINLKDQKRDQI